MGSDGEEQTSAEEAFKNLPGEDVSAAPAIPRRRGRRSNAELAADAGLSLEDYLKQKAAAPSKQTVTVKPKRVIPTEQSDFQKAIRPYKVPASLAVKLLDKLAVMAETSPLDKEEKDLHTDATAALMYEEVEVMSGKFLFLCSTAMIVIPRLIEKIDQRKKRKEEEAKGELAANTNATVRLMKDKSTGQ